MMYKKHFVRKYDEGFVEMLKQAIVEAGSVKKLARASRISRNSVSKWLYGKAVPTSTSAIKIEVFLTKAREKAND